MKKLMVHLRKLNLLWSAILQWSDDDFILVCVPARSIMAGKAKVEVRYRFVGTIPKARFINNFFHSFLSGWVHR
jgi:hypothetical protein